MEEDNRTGGVISSGKEGGTKDQPRTVDSGVNELEINSFGPLPAEIVKISLCSCNLYLLTTSLDYIKSSD